MDSSELPPGRDICSANRTTALGPLPHKKAWSVWWKNNFLNFLSLETSKFPEIFSIFSKNALISLVMNGFGAQIAGKLLPKPRMWEYFRKILESLENFEVDNDKNFRKLFFHHKLQVFFCGSGPSTVVPFAVPCATLLPLEFADLAAATLSMVQKF